MIGTLVKGNSEAEHVVISTMQCQLINLLLEEMLLARVKSQ